MTDSNAAGSPQVMVLTKDSTGDTWNISVPSSTTVAGYVPPVGTSAIETLTPPSLPVMPSEEAIAVLTKKLYDELSGTVIEPTNTSVASHDEEDDVRLVDEVMSKLRELLVREAQDGDSIWQLSDIIEAIKAVDWIKWNEQQDVIEQNPPMNSFASIEDELFTGGENMAISEEATAAINEAVTAGISPVIEALTKNSESIAALVAVLTKNAEATPVVETPVVEEPVAVATPVVVETPVVETPVVEATVEAAFPPAKDKEEEDEEDTKASATAETEGTTEASVEEEDQGEPMGGGTASAFLGGRSTVLLHTTEGRKSYLEGVAKANRIPVGVTNTVGDNKAKPEGDLVSQLANIFRRK